MCKLGEKLLPSKEAFEALGFKLSKPDGQYYQGSIPDGWRIELSNPLGHVNIVDQQGCNRVKYDYKNATMTLIPQNA